MAGGQDAPTSACPGCGAVLPAAGGPTHAYVGASPACWLRHGELLAREYQQLQPWQAHGLSVDTYAVQHPGKPERRTTQSLALHLMALGDQLERGGDEERRLRVLREAARRAPDGLEWLDPPGHYGMTVVDVLDRDPDEHREAVLAWARTTWQAWAPHHDRIRGWLDQVHARRR
ncbi:DUF5946 family protein [Conexibacter sp. SYSU D00693]|uniref:DUF5946 family protein n=1 Tax=Conexibacter sp. SYSU D00693 TaxID=2812560 RepID=UPI00196B0C66|nr:DUF5946 family protein [Conexibacter sp. SYSU D00693]